MDDKTRERVQEVAKALKELHLAANMEEALSRAKEIVASSQSESKSVNDLMKDVNKEAAEQIKTAENIEKGSEKAREELSKEAQHEHKQIEKNLESAKEDKATAKETKEQIKHDIKVHKLEKGDVEEATKDVDELECAAKDAEVIVEEADKVQEKKE